ncbi:LysR family transcriptional regulator [Cryptosporangium japonicum]|uniref:HTH lysR-type domain-containing protein n=1 Tax=Cryptosporangium japonicum TaxID=80872 RepID=A0ABP3DQV5_9ACTN
MRPSLDLRWVAYFVAVAEAGTVSAAADAVRVAQPSLSRQLRALEQDLGVDLFERAHGRLRLSPAGHALLPHARRLLARAEDLRVAAELQARGRLTHVTIAAPTTTLTDVVSPFLVTLTPDDPVPAVFVSDGDTLDDALRRGADLVITAEPPDRRRSFHPLPPLPVWAYVPPGHALAPAVSRDATDPPVPRDATDPPVPRDAAGPPVPRDAAGPPVPHDAAGASGAPAGTVEAAALAGEPLILLPAGHPARDAFDRAIGVPATIEASNGTVAQALAAAGRGVAVVSDDARYGLVPLAVVAADGAPVSVRLACAWNPGHPAASTLADLAARIERYVVRFYSARL